MLRGRTERNQTDGSGTAYPSASEPYAVDEHPMGIAFYRAKESFFLPYSLLEMIRFQGEKMTLLFSPADVAIEGRGLHQLYGHLASQKVSRIVEQDERYQDSSDSVVFINRIEQLPKATESEK